MARRATTTVAQIPRRRLGIVLVDPLPVVRAGLGVLISGHPDLEVLAEVGDADSALAAVGRIRRSRAVVLIGLGLAGVHDAFWLIRTLRERFPTYPVLACGANASVTEVSRALFVGADGFVDKNVDPEGFLDALRRAADREMVLLGPPSGTVIDIVSGIERRREFATQLTERERQVLTVAAEGLTARQIAERLGVRERTITTHLGRIYSKLGVGNRLSAIRAATRSGLVSVVNE